MSPTICPITPYTARHGIVTAHNAELAGKLFQPDLSHVALYIKRQLQVALLGRHACRWQRPLRASWEGRLMSVKTRLRWTLGLSHTQLLTHWRRHFPSPFISGDVCAVLLEEMYAEAEVLTCK